MCKGRQHRAVSRLVVSSLFLLLGVVSQADAQVKLQGPIQKVIPPVRVLPAPVSVVYSGKFVCGFENGISDFQGVVPSPLTDYRALEPGHYATTFSVLNASLSRQTAIQFFAVIPGQAPRAVRSPLTLSSFASAEITCTDIADALDSVVTGGAQGQVVKGHIYTIRPRDTLDIQGAYTYTSKDMYAIGGTSFFETAAELGGFFEIDSAAAGGLGLGASVDVVKVEARTLN